MTIKVIITNGEGPNGRSIRVVPRHWKKSTQLVASTNGEHVEIGPGSFREFYVHQLKDLIVEELDPERRDGY